MSERTRRKTENVVPDVGRISTLVAVLGALPLALLPLGSLAVYSSSNKEFAITFTYIATVVVGLFLLLLGPERMAQTSPTLNRLLPRTLGLVIIMVPAVFVAPDFGAAVAGFLKFGLGTVGGTLVGCLWHDADARQRSWFEWALILFLGGTTFQIFRLFVEEGMSLQRFHNVAVVSWGGSNLIAGCLVVAVLVGFAQARTSRLRAWLVFVSLMGSLAAVLIQSRGAVIALCAGILVIVWQWSRRTGNSVHWWRKLLLFAVPVGGMSVYEWAESTRLSENSQAAVNVDLRIELYRTAFSQFIAYPFQGSGWLALRGETGQKYGVASAFAHNFVISFLQIGGLLGLLFVVLTCFWILQAAKSSPNLVPALLAVFIVAMSDPFFEGETSALLIWMTICLASSFGGRPLAKSSLSETTSSEITES